LKISIVGAGNAGCFTALYYSWYGRKEDLEVELIHDPNIPPEEVGQATLLGAPELISTKFNYYDNYIHATPKTGILYEGFGKVNEKFIHAFPTNTLAMHFCPCELQKFALESGRFNVVEDNVDPKDVDADYVFDCRGTPKDFTGYTPLKSPVNAAILGKPKWDSKELWSRHVATPDGWAFVIPMDESSPSHNGAVGYLYNNKITKTEDAKKNFGQIFDVEVKRERTFKSYLHMNPIDDRVILQGNRLFFLEPMESTATETYLDWARATFRAIILKEHTKDDAIKDMKKYIRQVQNFILWHYQFGSKYDTPFWDHAKTMLFHDPLFDKFLNKATTLKLEELEEVTFSATYNSGVTWKNDHYRSATFGYAVWPLMSFKNWHEGMTLYKGE
tara:strand:+ start:230 stop:1393 length:1164 start_codon:yes stop_codon:yes gene_type:complete